MKIKRIEFIPGAGVNITATKTRTLYDENGNPVVIDEQEVPMAIGINDFAADPANPTEADHELARQKISEKLAELLTASDADLVAQNAVLSTKVENEKSAHIADKQELEKLRSEKAVIEQELQAERAAKQELVAQVEAIRSEKSVVEQELPRKDINGNDKAPAINNQ